MTTEKEIIQKKFDLKLIAIVLLGMVVVGQFVFSQSGASQKDIETKIEMLRNERKEKQEQCLRADDAMSGSIIQARKELAGLKILQNQELTQDEIILLNGNGTPASTTP